MPVSVLLLIADADVRNACELLRQKGTGRLKFPQSLLKGNKLLQKILFLLFKQFLLSIY